MSNSTNHNVIIYGRTKSRGLSQLLESEPQFVFEAHSTDYQGESALAALVQDGFPILEVGPELTFVLREALCALDLIATGLLCCRTMVSAPSTKRWKASCCRSPAIGTLTMEVLMPNNRY